MDDRGLPGQFFLTGSAVPADDITRHTGAGRLTRLRLRPMTLFETGHANGAASISGFLSGTFQHCPDPGLDVVDIAECVATGGWPAHQRLTTEQSILAVRDYLEEIVRADISRVDQRRRDPDKVMRVVRSLARNIATAVAISVLGVDAGGADGALQDETVSRILISPRQCESGGMGLEREGFNDCVHDTEGSPQARFRDRNIKASSLEGKYNPF